MENGCTKIANLATLEPPPNFSSIKLCTAKSLAAEMPKTHMSTLNGKQALDTCNQCECTLLSSALPTNTASKYISFSLISRATQAPPPTTIHEIINKILFDAGARIPYAVVCNAIIATNIYRLYHFQLSLPKRIAHKC